MEMRIEICQNQVGKFNFFSNEESLKFYMRIKQDDGEIVKDGDNWAELHYSGDEFDLQDEFSQCFENGKIGYIFNKCFEYANNVCSTTDYKARALYFWKVYQENKDDIQKQFVKRKKKSLQEQIDRAKQKLKNLDEFFFDDNGFDNYLQERLTQLEKWIKSDEEELSQIKEGTDKYAEKQKEIERKKLDVEKLKSLTPNL